MFSVIRVVVYEYDIDIGGVGRIHVLQRGRLTNLNPILGIHN